MPNRTIEPSEVVGWGIDADPNNEPTYPMRRRVETEHAGYTWERPTQQQSKVEVLHSNERPNLSASFGTSTPPRGLSGVIRRRAFKFSESSYGHWLPLMLADRVAVVEGYLEDLSHGRVPNIFAERGWNAEWRHNRPALMRRTATSVVVAGLIGAGLYLLFKPAESTAARKRPRPRLQTRSRQRPRQPAAR